ncbi:hypothetical protein SLEP1_g9287 [Rubroshorea leprosula]|uniref:Late embryogenesis abundant protein LEA-2 subgroup domain-containing protein n=1 Tax=Rubroshorea leprosula TaxID=152421 RepID=A0AAV5ICE6_9ROSI|nr:hypothetical protein SLEP1_g9287 [Rubroshorea leprosula]
MPADRPRTDSTHCLVWCAAIICAIITFGVIVAGVVTFIGYQVIHPKVPYVSVVDAHLDTIRIDYAGVLEVQATINMRAENGNRKARARFSHLLFHFSLDGVVLAHLVGGPFDVRKNSFVDFHYVAQSTPVALGPEQEELVDTSLKRNLIAFNLKGGAKARWKAGPLGSIKFTSNLDCLLRFHPLNGTYIPSRCTSSAS